jgi:hypothetical protein
MLPNSNKERRHLGVPKWEYEKVKTNARWNQFAQTKKEGS